MKHRGSTRRTRKLAAGFTLLEAMLAVMILCIGVLGLLSTIAFGGRLTRMDRETALAMGAVEEQLAELRSSDFAQLYSQFGSGGTVTFQVRGLSAQDGGPAGTLQLFADETLSIPQLGLPRDLNGDGDSTDSDVSTSYLLIPVRLTVNWVGPAGPREFQLCSILANR